MIHLTDKAVNLLSKKEYEVFKSDELILKFFDDSDYYIDYGKCVAILTKVSLKENKIDYGHRFMYYKINNELYESVYTNSISELIKMSKLIDSKKELKNITPFQLKLEL